jgi:hypothetical protein
MRYLVALWLLVFVVSCDYLKPDSDRVPLARVNDKYLYLDELGPILNEAASPGDSAQRVSAFINRWATQQLLIDQALINLPDEQLDRFEKLVQDYRSDLYTEAYKNAIVSKQLDSTVSEIELRTYYENNKEIFRLNEELVRMRFIHLDADYSNQEEIKKMFTRFDSVDQQRLDSLKIQFKQFNLNDSSWVRKQRIFAVVPSLAAREASLLKNYNFQQLQDSLGVYLVKINEVLWPNDIAPLSYVRPTIREILLNKRKLELIRQLETDITQDAIETDKFEIYNNQ